MFIKKQIGKNNPLNLQSGAGAKSKFKYLIYIFGFMFALACIIAGSTANAQEIREDGRVFYTFGALLKKEIPTYKDWNFKVKLIGHYTAEQKEVVQTAWKISGGDIDFLYMLKAENGTFDPLRRSKYFKNGVQEPSYGVCQIHKGYHPHIVNDERFFNDVAWQIEQCYNLYTTGTAFYGANRMYLDRSFAKKVQSHFNLYI